MTLQQAIAELKFKDEQIVRNHVGEQRQAARVRKSLKVLGPQDR